MIARRRPAAAVRRPRPVFASLAERNYRLFFWGQLVSVAGTWMQLVAQTWLVLELTGSGTVLGIVTAVRFVPILLLGPWAGTLADRASKRRVLLVTQASSGLLAAVFAVLVLTGSISVLLIVVLAGCLGVVNSVDNPARQSLIPELVSPGRLQNAVTLNSVTANMARAIGPAVGGVVLADLGVGICFVVNACSFGAVLVTLVLIRPAECHVAEGVSARRIRDGLRYVASEEALWVPLLMIAAVGVFTWEFEVSLPLLAVGAFAGDATTYAHMMSALGCGAVIGGLLAARRAPGAARRLAWTAGAWGAAVLAAALAPTLTVLLPCLALVGFGSISFNSLAKTTLQLAAVPAMRGRVMALWAMAWMGSTPLGGPLIGWVAGRLGSRAALIVGAAAAVAAGLAAYPGLRRADARAVEPARPNTVGE